MDLLKKLYEKWGPATVLIRCALFLIAITLVYLYFAQAPMSPEERIAKLKETEMPDWINVQLIDLDGHSRRGTELSDVQDIVIHYVANPGSTAQNNRDYYNSAASAVSSHFLVGLEGEIIQCVPLYEISSASNWRNGDTISVEVCHPDETGQFSPATYQSLVKLTAWLCDLCGIKSDRVIRHYDITGKLCPKYYVEHPEAWEQFLADVAKY